MMKQFIGVCAVTAIASALAPVSAQSISDGQWYADAGVGLGNIGANGVSLIGRAGNLFYPVEDMPLVFGAEAEVSIGVLGEDNTFYTVRPGLGIGAYGVAVYAVEDTPFEVFARAGIARIAVTYDYDDSYTGFEYDASWIGAVAGVGGKWRISENAAIRGDMNYTWGGNISVAYEMSF